MKQLIKSLTIQDFRSFDEKTVPLKSVSCLIGANESGKTNLLEAINLCKLGNTDEARDKQILRVQDTRKNSSRYNSTQLPEISYDIDSSVIQDTWLSEKLKLIGVDDIVLKRTGNQFTVDLPELFQEPIVIKNLTSVPIKFETAIEDLQDENDTEPKPSAPPLKKSIVLAPSGYATLSQEAFDEIENLVNAATDESKVSVLKGKDLKDELEKLALRDINTNLHIFFWSYDKDRYSLPDMISISEILEQWSSRPVIRAIFKLGGYTITDVKGLLEGRTETDYDNIFDALSRKVTEQIRSKWSSNQGISVQIRHKGDHLLISISDPGYSIEPEYRSEGMRWFLAFIIGIVAEADELKNYVILIDEPALHLHPGGQKDVLKEINRLAGENQVIYSTHSHFMIDRRFSNRVLFLFKEDVNCYSLTNFKVPTDIDIFKDPLLRSALLYNQSDISYLNEKNILVEGRFDKNVMEAVNNWLENREIGKFKTYDPNIVSVINCDGAGLIGSNAALYTGNGLLCIGVYDSDSGGESACKANKTLSDAQKVLLLSVTGEKSTMEDLIPDSVFQSALEEWEIKNEKVTGTITRPKMKNNVLPAIDLELQPLKTSTPPADTETITNKYLGYKHTLEDLLVKHLEIYLLSAAIDDSELQNLFKLITTLGEKTA